MMPWLILTLLGLTAADRPSERGLYWEYEPFATDASGRARAALNVTEMHVVFSNHLDAGFNVRAWCDGADGCTSTNNSKSGLSCRPWTYWVVQENIDTFLPRAIATAKGLRSSDTPFSYLTNSWLVAFLLDCEKSGLADWRPPAIGAPLLRCPNASAIAEFKAAVSRRDVHFHAFPFSSNPGLYDTSLFNATLRMALDQAATLGVRAPTTFSQRDETGMTRSIVPLLAASGVGMISLGSGGSSGGHPVIPDLFVWRDEATSTQVLFVHDHGYGGGVHILPNGVALYCAWNTDNGGPMSADRVRSIYSNLRTRYPGANVHASTFDDFYDASTQPGVMSQLPVLSSEIGDTWLYGDPSDPLKNVHFPTWYLGDNTNWTNAQLQAAITQPNYQLTISSWLEQRSYLPNALAVLDASKAPAYLDLATEMRDAIEGLRPAKPTAASLRAAGYTRADDASRMFVCAGVTVGFGVDGAVTTLTGRHAWASASAPLGRYTYQSLSAADFVTFDKDYGNGKCTPHSTDPGCHNFMKPNMIDAHPVHQEVHPTLIALWYRPTPLAAAHGAGGEPLGACEFAAESSVPSFVHTDYGAPEAVWMQLAVTKRHPIGDKAVASWVASFDVQLIGKTPTRLAEASWVSFMPDITTATTGWRLNPLNTSSLIDPTDVVEHGATHLHSIGPEGSVEYHGREGRLSLRPLDTPIVSMGTLSPFPTPGGNTTLPARMAGGVHANVQNNIWNTNYPQWYPFVPADADLRCRFELVVDES